MMRLCECCHVKYATDMHHRFSQTKWAKKAYGVLIHHDKNIQFVCNGCHASHANPDLDRWDEATFCRELGIEPRSKVLRGKYENVIV